MAASLRAQMLRRLLAPMLSVSLASGAVSYLMGLKYAGDAYDQSLLGDARALARELQIDQDGAHLQLSAQARDILVWDPYDRVYFRVETEDGTLIAGSTHLQPAHVAHDEEVFSNSRVNGAEVRVVTIDTGDPAHVRIAVGETLNKRNRLADEVLVAVVAPQLVLIGLVVVLIRAGVKRGLAPIGELEEAAHLRTPANLTPLPETHVPLELQPFTNAINALLARLRGAIETQIHFVADASHQLRTPLAALKVQLERALRETDPVAHREAMRQAVASLDRTTRLSNQLLLLARAEAETDAVAPFVQLDLRALAFDAGAEWLPRALARGADLGFDDPGRAVPVTGDPILLAELVNNLVDNALRYGGAAPVITIGVVPGDDHRAPMLYVEDDGPGIAPAAQDRLFQRFHRLPGSAGEGSGLGLAIVREIAHAHGAEVTLESPAATRGARFCVRFPLRSGALHAGGDAGGRSPAQPSTST